jgi:hypothetical protein
MPVLVAAAMKIFERSFHVLDDDVYSLILHQ